MDIEMTSVREYSESMPVRLIVSDDNRLAICAKNQGGCDCTQVDLLDLLEWLKSSPDVNISITVKET